MAASDDIGSVITSIMTFATTDLWVKADVLGVNLELTSPGAEPTVVVKIPSEQSEWVQDIDDYRVYNGFSTHVGGPLVSAAVAVVRVEVVYRNRRLGHLDAVPLAQAASKLGTQSRRTAELALAWFLDHLRACGQFWLGMSMQSPALIDGPTLWEMDAAQEPVRLPAGGDLVTIYTG